MAPLSRYRNKLLRKIRDLFFGFLYLNFRVVPKKIKIARGIRIIVYHGICEKNSHLFNSRFITKKQFEKQLQLIQKFYNPISFHDLINKNLSSQKLNVLITFDDGLKNNYLLAVPLLKKYQIPAVFFVTGVNSLEQPYLFNDIADIVPSVGNKEIRINDELFFNKKIGAHRRFVNKQGFSLVIKYHSSSHNERENVIQQLLSQIPINKIENYKLYYELMNDGEIKEISKNPIFYVASHGFYHTDLSCINSHSIDMEILKSVQYLENITATKINTIAFPYGNYNKTVIECCEQNNFKHLFKTENKVKDEFCDNLYERQTINPFVSPILQMYYIAKNNYE